MVFSIRGYVVVLVCFVIISLFCVLFLINNSFGFNLFNIDSQDLDEIVLYDFSSIDINYVDDNMTIEFKDGDGIVGKATLKSHNTYDEVLKIPSGEDRVVVWYEFSGFKDTKFEAIKGVEFIDFRRYVFDEKIDDFILNLNYMLPVEKDYNIVYQNDEGDWVDCDAFDIPKETILIGVQIDLAWGERLDVRFNIFDNVLNRHAIVEGTNAGFVDTAPEADPAGGASYQAMDKITRAIKVTTPAQEVTITEIGWWSSVVSEEAYWDCAIYTHDAENDYPEDVVGSIITNTAKGTTIGWKKVSGLNIPLSSDTIYWIAISMTDTLTTSRTDREAISGGRYAGISGQEDLADPWVDSWGVDNYFLSIYALYSVGGEDSCTCTESEDWEIDMEDFCILSDNCSPNDVTFINTGNFTCNAILNATSIGGLAVDQLGYIDSSCQIIDR